MLATFRKWFRDEDASAAIEAGFLLPVLAVIMCGMVDIGIGLITNLKVTNASQTIADLLARETSISDTEFDNAIEAGKLSLLPYDTEANFGYDIAGIQFVGNTLTPTVKWRDTLGMEPNLEAAAHSAGLGFKNEGVIAVTVRYVYEPYFSGYIFNTMVMEEESYVRGRKGGFVLRE